MPDINGPYNERIGGTSPNTAGFNRMGGGKATHIVLVGDKGNGSGAIADVNTLYKQIREILGYTQKHSDSIRLSRMLPKFHPMFPWLAATRISNMVGKGQYTVVNAPVDSNCFESFALHETYELTVEFEPRPYSFGRDEDIPSGQTVTWYKEDGTNTALGYAKEWYRYTDIEVTPAAEWLTADAGGFQFDVASGQNPDTFPAGKGQLKMLIPQGSLKVTWYEVPYSYVETIGVTSYIQYGLGHVNQTSWRGYAAGTLLLAAVNVNRYLPAIPKFAAYEDSAILAPEKFCDITFVMLHRNPPLGKDAAGNTATPDAPVDSNTIQAGHNYFPLAHMSQWYYAKTTGVSGFTNANDRPAFPSFPFELLFTNPGV